MVGNIIVPVVGALRSGRDLVVFLQHRPGFWMILFTVVMYRLFFRTHRSLRLTPTLFILLAPPSVGFIAYSNLVGGLDAFGHIPLPHGPVSWPAARKQRCASFIPFFASAWAYSSRWRREHCHASHGGAGRQPFFGAGRRASGAHQRRHRAPRRAHRQGHCGGRDLQTRMTPAWRAGSRSALPHILAGNHPREPASDRNQFARHSRVRCAHTAGRGRQYAIPGTSRLLRLGATTRHTPARWAPTHRPSRHFFFMKPATAVQHHGRIAYPTRTEDYHHEVELVVALSNGGRDIPVVAALDRVFGYGVGLDLTRRDVQAALKKSENPGRWAGADQSAPVSAITPVATCGHPASGAIRLTVNDRIVQQGDLADMIPGCAAHHRRAIHLVRTHARRPDLHRHPGRGTAPKGRSPARQYPASQGSSWSWCSPARRAGRRIASSA